MGEQLLGDRDTATSGLARELRLLVGKLRRRLRQETSPGDFTPSQISAVSRLMREGPATVTTLARDEGVRPQSMGATIAVLEAAGLVAGAPDPSDGRQTILSLTPACRTWIDANRAAREDWLSRTLTTEFTAAEQDDLARAVALLMRLVDS